MMQRVADRAARILNEQRGCQLRNEVTTYLELLTKHRGFQMSIDVSLLSSETANRAPKVPH